MLAAVQGQGCNGFGLLLEGSFGGQLSVRILFECQHFAFPTIFSNTFQFDTYVTYVIEAALTLPVALLMAAFSCIDSVCAVAAFALLFSSHLATVSHVFFNLKALGTLALLVELLLGQFPNLMLK